MSKLGRPYALVGTVLRSRLAQWSQRSFIKSIQRGTITIGNAAATATATITAVVLANSDLRWLGATYDTATSIANRELCCYLELTNTTTITATRIGTANGLIVSYELVEYWPGVIKSVQRGLISLVSVTSNTATITAVNTAKTGLTYLGLATNDSNTNLGERITLNLVLTNATTVTATDTTNANTTTTSYQALEWY